MTNALEGRTAIVTGGTRGIGEAIAEAMLREGARVVVVSRRSEGVTAAVQRLRDATDGEVAGVTGNMGRVDEIPALWQAICQPFGAPDILVNNAATNPYFGPMLNLEFAAWDKTFDVNLKGAFALTQLFARRLTDASLGGAIINISSIYGQHAAPLQGIYGMTKAALISMTQTLAAELGSANIRVNCIAPGLIETRFSRAITSNSAFVEMYTSRAALHSVGQPSDVAGAAVWLASDAARFVTGQTLTVDGGYLIS